jgi:ATP-dependent Clp protease ATP-binding subunit ClpA
MSTNKLQDCWDALNRLKAGEPNNKKFLGQLITNSIVSQEADLDAGYIKNKRLSHKAIVTEIDDYKEEQQEGSLKTQVKELRGKLAREESKSKQFKQDRDDALARELLLYDRLCELEKEVKASSKVVNFNKL